MTHETCVIRQFEVEICDLGGFLDSLRALGESEGVHIVLFDADRMAGRAHVESALAHAFRAFREGTPISHRLEMEALLYASASRQCQMGMEFGAHPGVNRVYLCICPGSRRVREELSRVGVFCDDEDWESMSDEREARLIALFGITPEEREVAGPGRIQDLVLERVALLEVYR